MIQRQAVQARIVEDFQRISRSTNNREPVQIERRIEDGSVARFFGKQAQQPVVIRVPVPLDDLWPATPVIGVNSRRYAFPGRRTRVKSENHVGRREPPSG